MLRGGIILIVVGLIGEMLRQSLALPVSGPVLGIILLLLLFIVRRGVLRRWTRPACHCSGISRCFSCRRAWVSSHRPPSSGGNGLAMAVALLGSSVLGLLAAAAALRVLDHMSGPRTPNTRSTQMTVLSDGGKPHRIAAACNMDLILVELSASANL
jgi:holin-like protein